jgi:hypothetical protein
MLSERRRFASFSAFSAASHFAVQAFISVTIDRAKTIATSKRFDPVVA